jgi:hypothetical protein
MSPRPVSIRRHAILKRPYRRAVAATADYHQRSHVEQWALLRAQVQADTTPTGPGLLEILDRRAPRRDEVLAALEEGRQAHAL